MTAKDVLVRWSRDQYDRVIRARATSDSEQARSCAVLIMQPSPLRMPAQLVQILQYTDQSLAMKQSGVDGSFGRSNIAVQH